jgi:hypothetical protein
MRLCKDCEWCSEFNKKKIVVEKAACCHPEHTKVSICGVSGKSHRSCDMCWVIRNMGGDCPLWNQTFKGEE